MAVGLAQPRAEPLAKNALSLWRDRDGARAVDAAYPVLPKTVRADGCADRARNMRTPLAPIEAGPTQDASRAPAIARRNRIDVNADAIKKFDSRIRNQTAIAGQLDVIAHDQRIGERDTETAGKVVVAGPRSTQSRISRTDSKRRSRRVEAGCYLHNAFHHLCHRGRRYAVIAMPALLLDAEKTRHSQTRQMA